ncbi:MAG: T9SS type A sorting domain-containing protein [bacterium]|nr:T9SS type A sorting domain-containing protein [bacterium]
MKITILTAAVLLVSGAATAAVWIIETVDSEGNVGLYPSIALDDEDNPHIAYYDMSNYDLKYAYGKRGSWYITPVDVAGEIGGHTSISFMPDGPSTMGHAIIISYIHNADSSMLKYAFLSSDDYITGSWSFFTILGTEGASMSSIAAGDGLDLGGLVFIRERWRYASTSPRHNIAYYDSINEELKLVHMREDDFNIGRPNINPPFDSVEGAGPFPSVAADHYDNPHISYYANGDLKYYYYSHDPYRFIEFINDPDHPRRFEDAIVEWFPPSHTALVDDEGDVGANSSIAVDSAGNPHISYYDASNSNLKYAYRTEDNAWIRTTVDSEGIVGEFTSIAVDSGDNPHISYFDASNGNLKYARWMGSTWDITPVDTVGGVGLWTSIALDSWDNPHIVYYDFTNHNLKYARFVYFVFVDFDLPEAVLNTSDGTASISFTLPYATEVDLTLYDAKGNKITTLAEGKHQPGEYTVDTDNLAPGVYTYELKADKFSDCKKLVVK